MCRNDPDIVVNTFVFVAEYTIPIWAPTEAQDSATCTSYPCINLEVFNICINCLKTSEPSMHV